MNQGTTVAQIAVTAKPYTLLYVAAEISRLIDSEIRKHWDIPAEHDIAKLRQVVVPLVTFATMMERGSTNRATADNTAEQ